MKTILKNSIFVILALLFIAVLLNFDYFSKQAQYYLSKKNISENLNNNSFQPSPTNLSEKGESNQLSIPSLQITAPIQYTEENNENKFQELLQSGVVHFPGTAEIGQPGNVYIFGHSSDFEFTPGKFKTVFALLPHIEKGAEITVSDKSGQLFHYEVIDSRAVEKDDVSVLDQQGYKQKLLTLQTSYPVGTALRRWIVLAKLKE